MPHPRAAAMALGEPESPPAVHWGLACVVSGPAKQTVPSAGFATALAVKHQEG